MNDLEGLVNKYYETGDLDCIDDFADALTQAVEDAEDNEQLAVILSQLEDIVVEDMVRTSDLSAGTSGEPGPSNPGDRPEAFLQAASLILLPQIAAFPSFSAESAEAIMKLLLLVCQRGNAKELVMAIEQGLERLRNIPSTIDRDEYIDRLGRLISALTTVLARVRSKRPAALLSPVVAQLSAALEEQPIVEAVPDEEASAVFILESVEKLLQAVSTLVDQETLQILQPGLHRLVLAAVSSQLSYLPQPFDFSTGSQSHTLFKPPDVLQMFSAAAKLIGLDAEVLLGPSDEPCIAHVSEAHLVLLACVMSTTATSDPSEPLARLLRYVLDGAGPTSEERQDTSGYAVYLLQHALRRTQLIGDAQPEKDALAIVQYCIKGLPASSPATTQAVINLLKGLILHHCDSQPALQTKLIHILLRHEDVRTRCIGLSILQSIVSQHNEMKTSPHIDSFMADHWSAILPWAKDLETLFSDDAAQTYCVSALNLIYLLLKTNQASRKSDIWQSENQLRIQKKLLRPIRQTHARADPDDISAMLTASIVADALSRVESCMTVNIDAA